MSPPEVWGPAIWTLFHTLAEKINENAYPYIIDSMFIMIVRICKFLPCPECSRDASSFLAKINIRDYKTKTNFKNLIYLFHNWVNAKKHKPLFNYALMNKYSKLNIVNVINNFISKYNTKGNMKLLTETFQRTFIIRDFIAWFKTNSVAFLPNNKEPKKPVINEEKIEENIVEENVVQEKSDVQENVVEEKSDVVEENVVQENVEEEKSDVVEENVVQENVEEEKSDVEENVVQENVEEEKSNLEENVQEERLSGPVIEEEQEQVSIPAQIVEEELISTAEKPKTKKGKKSKKNK